MSGRNLFGNPNCTFGMANTNDSDDEQEAFEFSVTDLVGNCASYTATSFEDLRAKVAIDAGVLSPCILLLFHADGGAIEDSEEIREVVGRHPPPHKVDFVNKLEEVKNEVSEWSAGEWIRAVKLHQGLGDQHVALHAQPLQAADNKFNVKMHEWAEFHSVFEKEEEARAEDLKAATALGVHELLRGGGGEPFLHDAAGCGDAECWNPDVRAAMCSACKILGVQQVDISPYDSVKGQFVRKKTLELMCSARRKLIY